MDQYQTVDHLLSCIKRIHIVFIFYHFIDSQSVVTVFGDTCHYLFMVFCFLCLCT